MKSPFGVCRTWSISGIPRGDVSVNSEIYVCDLGVISVLVLKLHTQKEDDTTGQSMEYNVEIHN